MKGKINLKTIIVIVIIVLVVILGVLGVNTVKTLMSGAAGGAQPNNMTAVSAESGNSATVTWSSDKEILGIVEYGTNPASLILRVEETTASMSHNVNLSNLRANVVYYYRVRVGDEIFDNSGVPYTFKTKGAEVTPTVAKPSVSTPSTPLVSTPSAKPSSTVLLPTILTPSPATSGAKVNCNKTTDYNKDKIINSLDYITCIKNGGIASVAIPTPSTAGAIVDCAKPGDYNKDGFTNSLDRIKCLQDKK
ncbi:MAG: fibronectin type III domain-containing protein [Candidatus Shapirobacteria bacterium]